MLLYKKRAQKTILDKQTNERTPLARIHTPFIPLKMQLERWSTSTTAHAAWKSLLMAPPQAETMAEDEASKQEFVAPRPSPAAPKASKRPPAVKKPRKLTFAASPKAPKKSAAVQSEEEEVEVETPAEAEEELAEPEPEVDVEGVEEEEEEVVVTPTVAPKKKPARREAPYV